MTTRTDETIYQEAQSILNLIATNQPAYRALILNKLEQRCETTQKADNLKHTFSRLIRSGYILQTPTTAGTLLVVSELRLKK